MDVERRYHQFVLDGGGSESSGEDGDEDGEDGEGDEEEEEVEEEENEWTACRNEADVHNLMQRLCHAEVETYHTLKDRQGEDIPRFLACTTIPSSYSLQDPSLRNHVDMPGILLQYIDGFHLTDLAQHAPRETWQSVCENAVRLTNLITTGGF